MNEVQHYKMEESAALGKALMDCLAEMYGCDPTEASIKRGVYKRTDCGAWIAFTEKGVKIGSIVEGCDHDGTESFDVNYNGDDDAFKKEFFERMAEIERQASELWDEYNKEKS